MKMQETIQIKKEINNFNSLDCCLCGEKADGVIAGFSLCNDCLKRIVKEWMKRKGKMEK